MTFTSQQKARAAKRMRNFDLEGLFVEELGWDRPPAGAQPLKFQLDGLEIPFEPVVHKREFYLFHAQAADGEMPAAAARNKAESWLSRRNHEHIIVYTDVGKTEQVWQWVRREPGRPLRRFTHRYTPDQPGDSLLQKLELLEVSFEEEDDIHLTEVVGRARAAFNVEGATRRFFERFKKEREAFERFVQGISDEADQDWYVSVMLNRLMFVYFIQKKGFLDGDNDYLHNRLRRVQAERGANQFHTFYRYFLLRLFHEGLGLPVGQRDPALEALIGRVPYLNGGIFQVHEIEQRYPAIEIEDEAFERVLEFFGQYQWHLDDRPLRRDNEINPDVLGYIFEKFVNQKQMGAYYTKEDITQYISQNTIIPYLFDAAQKKVATAFQAGGPVWSLLPADPDRYIYAAVRHGYRDAAGNAQPLPAAIAAGIEQVSARGSWNTPTPAEFGLPTEIWRETVARRQRYEEVKAKLAGGEVTAINDLITLNLDIRQFAQDVVEQCEGTDLLSAFWEACNEVTVLDPTCGSGAFLFAALNILEPLYEACISRMEAFVSEPGFVRLHPNYTARFGQVLEQIERHPNREYYVLKRIMVNNLYGVDIMPEAVEICKLRLFLKLAAQVETAEQIEPLPDIDFNIRAGNTLVGFATKEEVLRAIQGKQVSGGAQQFKLLSSDDQAALAEIEERAQAIDRLAGKFREQQTALGGEVTPGDKQALRDRLRGLEETLNRYLAREYGVKAGDEAGYRTWLASHQPFHWFVEFYGISQLRGGFDTAIGNPPYVVYSSIRSRYRVFGYETESCDNLYAFVLERTALILSPTGRSGFIIPVASVSADGLAPLRSLLARSGSLITSNYGDRPSKLFEGLEHIRLSIILLEKRKPDRRVYTTTYHKWSALERKNLFANLRYGFGRVRYDQEVFPKISTETELSILSKLQRQSTPLEFYVHPNGSHRIYYTRKLSHFVQVLDFVPLLLDKDGNARDPSELKVIRFDSKQTRDVLLGLLNSGLFYWYLTTHSDCRNLNRRDVVAVRFDLTAASEDARNRLSLLTTALMEDFRANSEMLSMSYTNLGQLKIQAIYPKRSKSILDDIDVALAEHYGFSAEELDFLLNYGIKHRMGDEL